MTDGSAGATIAALERSFEIASEEHLLEIDGVIAGRRVRFRHASPVVAEAFRPAFAHSFGARGTDEPALTIDLWDSSAGAPVPFPIPDVAGNEAWFQRIGDVQILVHPARRVLSVFDPSRKRAWWWIEDAGALPWFEQAAPMRHLVNWWAAAEGLALVHAAAIGRDDGGALVVGRGGAGKSTLALAAVGAGMRFCGDDMVILERSDEWVAHTVWASARLVDGGEHLVPHIEARRLVDGDDPDVKLVADVWAQFGRSVVPALPVRVVVRPEIGVASAPRPSSAGRAALELATSTFLNMPGGNPSATLSTIARMVEEVPVHGMGVSPDLAIALDAIDRLLADAGGR